MQISNSYPTSSLQPFFSQKKDKLLSDLLPSIQNNYWSALQEYSLLLKALIGTIDALERGDLRQFDALVKDRLCQIRAYINAENFEV